MRKFLWGAWGGEFVGVVLAKKPGTKCHGPLMPLWLVDLKMVGQTGHCRWDLMPVSLHYQFWILDFLVTFLRSKRLKQGLIPPVEPLPDL